MNTDCDIAIVGVGCRFPGAENTEEFWRVLLNGENHVKEIPEERWNNSAFYSEDKDAAGKIYAKKAGLLKNYDEWDPSLFGISEMEAERIDPQQRHVLDCVHMALEDGGITRSQLNGSQTGVYIGSMNNDYEMVASRDLNGVNTYTATGVSASILAARVSYVYNLQGPCLTLDTACSSALIAVHLGSQAIQTGDCDLAVCGGVSIIISPDKFVHLCRAHMMSATGQCQAFCDTADGYARGEGCGIVILKKLDQALKDGNKIWAVVKTGTNQDGRASQPITAPSAEQQGKLFEKVYTTFHVDPATIQYIEAHGTGTQKGDSAEVNALGRFFSKHRTSSSSTSESLLIGSVKTNIGHTESAAGAASLIKILLMMKHGTVVPSLHLNSDKSNINPEIRIDKYDMDIAVDVREWQPNTVGARIGCVNSFGFGGSNCHSVVIQKPEFQSSYQNFEEETDLPKFVCLSACDFEGIRNTILQFQMDLEKTPEQLADISHTSTCRRDHFPYRTCFSAKTLNELKKQVGAVTVHDNKPSMPKHVVFVYCGVGTTWTGMCSTLMKTDRTFRESMEILDQYLYPLSGFSVAAKLSDPATDYSDPFLNHIAIFAVQLGLTDMWRHLGICPDVIVGQSIGEVAAAYASGSLDLKNAVDVIYYRSKILASRTGGAMMVVKNLEVSEVENVCSQFDKNVTIAVYSSPIACTLSGDSLTMRIVKTKIESIAKTLKREILTIDLNVACAYHSHQMEPCMSEIQDRLQGIKSQTRSIPIVSTVTADFASENEFQTAEYWAQNIRQPVKFWHALEIATKSNAKNIFVEIGPKGVLGAHFKDIFKEEQFHCIPSMRYQKENEAKVFAMKQLYEYGLDISWDKMSKPKYTVSSIPRYVFNKKKKLYLPESEKKRFQGISTTLSSEHRFVKDSMKTGNPFQIIISRQATPFVSDHYLSNNVLVPGTTYVEAALAIAKKTLKVPINQVEVSVEFVNPFFPVSGMNYELDCEVIQRKERFSVKITKDGRLFCTGNFNKRKEHLNTVIDIRSIKRRCPYAMTTEEVYKRLAGHNFRYGPSMSLIQRSWSSETECLAELSVPDCHLEEVCCTHMHPIVVDTVLQLFGIFKEPNAENGQIFPRGIKSVVVNRPVSQKLYCYAALLETKTDEMHFNALLVDADGFSVCELRDVNTKEQKRETTEQRHVAYNLKWCQLDQKTNDTDTAVGPLCSGRSVLVFGTEQTRELYQRTCRGLNCEVIFIDLCNIYDEPRATMEAVFKEFKDSEVKAVIYAAGNNNCSTEVDCTCIYRTAKQTFTGLSKLLVLMTNFSFKIPVFVVTDNTQSIPDQTLRNTHVKGSELWGMVRCARLEFMNSYICLIDVDQNNLCEEIFCRVIDQRFTNEDEFVIRGPFVYVCRLEEFVFERQRKTTRFVQVEKEDVAYLKSAAPSNATDLAFDFQRNEWERKVVAEEMANLQLISVCLHSSELYAVSSDPSDQKVTVWPELAANGFQMIALEGVGHVTSLDKNGIRDTQAQITYFCCPVDISTYVNVPVQLTVPQIDLPYYIPGLLTASVVLFNLSLEVLIGSSVCAVADYNDRFITKFLSQVLQSKRECSVSFKQMESFESPFANNGVKTHNCIVLLSRADIHIIKVILKGCTYLKQIVTFSEFISTDTQRWIKHNCPDISLSVLSPDELFEEQQLRLIFPAVRQQLNKLDSLEDFMNTSSTEDNVNPHSLSLPFETVTLSGSGRKKPIPLRVGRSHLFRRYGCYVVVGGLTGLGWVLMKLIAEMGGGHLVSISRRQPSADKRIEIKQLMSETQSQISCIQADISDLKSIQSAFVQIQASLCGVKIKGIFNGAGVLADMLLVNMTEHEIDKAMRPKIIGSWNLHLVSRHLDLDYFVMHSSVVSILGNAGQCNYGAGNAFMDSLAHYRRSLNLCGQSINWGALDVGMAKGHKSTENSLRRKGLEPLLVEDICSCFVDAIISNKVQITYGNFDWSKLAKNMAGPAKLQDLAPQEFRNKPLAAFGNEVTTLDIGMFLTLNKTERSSLILELIKSTMCQVIPGFDKADISPASNTVRYFGESFEAVAFVNKMFDLTGCKIDVQILRLEETTIRGIVDFLLEHISITDTYPAADIIDNDPILALDSGVSFMERAILDEYFEDPENPSLIRVFEIEINGTESDFNFWKQLFHHVVVMNKGLCKTYIMDNGVLYAKYIPEEAIEIDFGIVKYDSLKNGDVRKDISFDLTKELPIKFRVGYKDGCTVLRLILHAVITDLTSAILIAKDTISTAIAQTNGDPFPARNIPVDAAQVFQSKLNRRVLGLRFFWQNQLSRLREPLSLGSGTISKIDADCNKLMTGMFTQDLAEAVFEFVIKKNLTLFQFFTSVFQVYLHRETGGTVVPVLSKADMRIHAPEVRQCVARCLNNVPFVAVINPKQPISEFIAENGVTISSTVENSFYPYQLIEKEMADDVRQDIGRHRILMDNLSELNPMLTYKNQVVKVRNVWHSRSREKYELLWNIFYDMDAKQLWYKFGYNAAICGEERGARIPEKLLSLVKEIMINPDDTCTPERLNMSAGELLSSKIYRADDFNGLVNPDVQSPAYSVI